MCVCVFVCLCGAGEKVLYLIVYNHRIIDVLGRKFPIIIECSITFVLERERLNLKCFYIRYLQTVTIYYAKMEGVGILLVNKKPQVGFKRNPLWCIINLHENAKFKHCALKHPFLNYYCVALNSSHNCYKNVLDTLTFHKGDNGYILKID